MTSAPRILLIDDNADIRETIGARLNASGFAVTTAASGREGLEAAAASEFSLILLDMLMPQQDGVATYNALRADPKTQQIPVILLTAMAVETHWEALPDDAGAPCFVMGKPYDLGILLTRVRDVLGRERPESVSGS